jgi:hypothetical protein
MLQVSKIVRIIVWIYLYIYVALQSTGDLVEMGRKLREIDAMPTTATHVSLSLSESFMSFL